MNCPERLLIPYGASRLSPRFFDVVRNADGEAHIDCRVPHVIIRPARRRQLRLNDAGALLTRPATADGQVDPTDQVSLLRAAFEDLCGLWWPVGRCFVSTYFDLVESLVEEHRRGLESRLVEFGALYHYRDWIYSAPAPLPRAWIPAAQVHDPSGGAGVVRGVRLRLLDRGCDRRRMGNGNGDGHDGTASRRRALARRRRAHRGDTAFRVCGAAQSCLAGAAARGVPQLLGGRALPQRAVLDQHGRRHRGPRRLRTPGAPSRALKPSSRGRTGRRTSDPPCTRSGARPRRRRSTAPPELSSHAGRRVRSERFPRDERDRSGRARANPR